MMKDNASITTPYYFGKKQLQKTQMATRTQKSGKYDPLHETNEKLVFIVIVYNLWLTIAEHYLVEILLQLTGR